MSALPKLISSFNTIHTKITASHLWVLTNWKSIQRFKRPRTASATLKEKNRVGRLTLPDLKAPYRAAVMKTVWCWWRAGQISGTERRAQEWTHTNTGDDLWEILKGKSMETRESFQHRVLTQVDVACKKKKQKQKTRIYTQTLYVSQS